MNKYIVTKDSTVVEVLAESKRNAFEKAFLSLECDHELSNFEQVQENCFRAVTETPTGFFAEEVMVETESEYNQES